MGGQSGLLERLQRYYVTAVDTKVGRLDSYYHLILEMQLSS